MYTLKRALLNYTEKHLNICNYVIPNNIITNDTITIKKTTQTISYHRINTVIGNQLQVINLLN